MISATKLGVYVAAAAMLVAAIAIAKEGAWLAQNPPDGWTKGVGRVVEVKSHWRGDYRQPVRVAKIAYSPPDSELHVFYSSDCQAEVGVEVAISIGSLGQAKTDGRKPIRVLALLFGGLGMFGLWGAPRIGSVMHPRAR